MSRSVRTAPARRSAAPGERAPSRAGHARASAPRGAAPRLDATGLAGLTALMNPQHVRVGLDLEEAEKAVMGKATAAARPTDADPVRLYTEELNRLAADLGIDLLEDAAPAAGAMSSAGGSPRPRAAAPRARGARLPAPADNHIAALIDDLDLDGSPEASRSPPRRGGPARGRASPPPRSPRGGPEPRRQAWDTSARPAGRADSGPARVAAARGSPQPRDAARPPASRRDRDARARPRGASRSADGRGRRPPDDGRGRRPPDDGRGRRSPDSRAGSGDSRSGSEGSRSGSEGSRSGSEGSRSGDSGSEGSGSGDDGSASPGRDAEEVDRIIARFEDDIGVRTDGHRERHRHRLRPIELPRAHDDDRRAPATTDEQDRRRHINSVLNDVRGETRTAFGVERERSRDLKASKLEQIGQLKLTLDEEGIDTSAVGNPSMDSHADEIDSVLGILRLKNDRNRYSSLAEEVILGGAEALSQVFDGTRAIPILGWRPDYTGFACSVNVKLHRMRAETSQIVGNIIERHNIGPTARILLELAPSLLLYPRQMKRQRGTPDLAGDPHVADPRDAMSAIRAADEKNSLDDVRRL